MYRNGQRSFNGGSEFFTEPLMPPINSRPSGQRKNSEDPESPSGFSPGLLDLHSFDTELLPEVGFCCPIVFDLYFDVGGCKITCKCWHCGFPCKI
ncbi:hypothetical protein CsSME_00007549 [Camellia sinensis var. sinensis]